ncbi:MAG TPA: hypothetical protein VHZ51_29860 [Ktedonobacteraceae bacterium]|nr:hypothetical protein [Ktedonobacteraceae bacterium]
MSAEPSRPATSAAAPVQGAGLVDRGHGGHDKSVSTSIAASVRIAKIRLSKA